MVLRWHRINHETYISAEPVSKSRVIFCPPIKTGDTNSESPCTDLASTDPLSADWASVVWLLFELPVEVDAVSESLEVPEPVGVPEPPNPQVNGTKSNGSVENGSSLLEAEAMMPYLR